MSYGTDEPTTPTGYLGSRPTSHTSTPAFPVSPPAGQQYGPPPVYGAPVQRGPQEYSTASFAPPPGFPPGQPPRKKKSRKVELILVAVIALAAIGLGTAYALASSGTPAAKTGASAGAKPADTPADCGAHGRLPNGSCAEVAGSNTDDFLAAARALPIAVGVEDDKLLELGQAMCDALARTGGDVAALLDVDTSVPKKQVLELAKVASTYLCSPFKDKVAAYVLPVGIEDGNWLPGTDFPVGTYETTTQAEDCYWDVTTGDGDKKHYVEQEIGPGHYKVKLKAGQKFETQGCGTWKKIG